MRERRRTARRPAVTAEPAVVDVVKTETGKKKPTLPWLFVGVLFVAVAVAFVFRQAEVIAVQKNLASMQQEIAYYKALNESMEKQIAALQSDEYIEKSAREKLGLVKPGEVQFMVVGYKTKD